MGIVKRKICFVITSKIHYSRSKLLLKKLQQDPRLELKIVIGASAILSKFGNVIEEMKKDGFPYDAKITMTIDGGSPISMAKTAGLGIIEFSTVFDNLQPDIVVIRGDRYEVLSAAIAASYLNIPVAHIEGGDITGTIDELVRHAITKVSHIHFVTNDEARARIIRMGEHLDYVFTVGCPSLEYISSVSSVPSVSVESIVNYLGVGVSIDVTKPYLIVMFHSVTTEIDKNADHTKQLLQAIEKIGIQTIWFWPNVDAGTDDVSKELRRYREHAKQSVIRFVKYLPTEEFITLLKYAACLVGNSSAGIKEAPFLGIPVVNIGSRQSGRYKSPAVIDVNPNVNSVVDGITKQLGKRYQPSTFFFKENTSDIIVNKLATLELYIQKRFID